VGLMEYSTYFMPIAINDFYTMINLHTIGPTIIKKVDI